MKEGDPLEIWERQCLQKDVIDPLTWPLPSDLGTQRAQSHADPPVPPLASDPGHRAPNPGHTVVIVTADLNSGPDHRLISHIK